MLKCKLKKFINDESSGEIMLESTLIMIFTIFMLIAIISVGFLFYQQIAVGIAANDVASEIAATYKISNSNANGNLEVEMYRTSFTLNAVKADRKLRAERLFAERMPLTTLGIDSDVKVSDFDVIIDNVGRMHVELTATVKSEILFGGALEFFGIIDSTPTFTAVGRAECLDITAYAGHVQFFRYVGNVISDTSIGKSINDIIGIIEDIESIMDVFQ